MDVDLNEIIISGIVNNIRDDNNLYIKFSLITKTNNKNIYSSLNVSNNLYEIYKDFFVKGNKVFIKGYLNSYMDLNKKIQTFITVIDISDNKSDILNGRKAPHIRTDLDNVLVWNGKRCEKVIPTKEEQQELEKLLNEFK